MARLCDPQLPPPSVVPQIRRSMIDGNDGQRFIKTLIKSLDEVMLQGKGVMVKATTVLSTSPSSTRLGAGIPCHCTSSVLAPQRPDWLPLTTAIHRRGVQDLHVGPHQKHQLQVSGTDGTTVLTWHQPDPHQHSAVVLCSLDLCTGQGLGLCRSLPAVQWVTVTCTHPAAQAAKLPLHLSPRLHQQMCKKDSGIMSVLSNSCCLHSVRSHVVPLPPRVPSSSSPPSSGGAGKGHSHVPALSGVHGTAQVLSPTVASLQNQAALARRGR